MEKYITIRHKTRRFYVILAIRTIGNFFILFSLLWLAVVFSPLITQEIRYHIDQLQHKTYSLDRPSNRTFAGLLKEPPPLTITPVNTTNSIIVEKINANSPIIFDVDAANETEYRAALAKGVAQAKGTVLPGENGNSYLFAHSVGSPWDVARYNAVFYLLTEVNVGDRVVIFRDGWRYDFRVSDKKIVDPNQVEFLYAQYDKPTLTLQTCWPPGTVLKRLLVFATLEKSYPPLDVKNKLLD